jgi:hypothetical protein
LIAFGALAAIGYAFRTFGPASRGGGSSAPSVRLNPRSPDGRGIARAKNFRESFTWGEPAGPVRRVKIAKAPRHLVKLGKLEQVTYSTTKKGDGFSHYVHDFGKERGRGSARSRPTLAIDMDNKRLHVIGGSYTVTDRGIEG